MAHLAATRVSRFARRKGGDRLAARAVPEETPVALSYGGTTHAVMMTTPADLEDFALGFSVTEGIVTAPEEIEQVTVEELGVGIDLQIHLRDAANRRFEARRRRLAGPVGCGLCGIESIGEAMRTVPSVGRIPLVLRSSDIAYVVDRLSVFQKLHRQTGAVHAAGLFTSPERVSLLSGRMSVATMRSTSWPAACFAEASVVQAA